jgi:uncharacterized protein (TIGR00369 family)
VDNPHGFALEFYRHEGLIFAEVAVPDMYRGYDGVVHGGMVALLLDEAMGWAANCASGGATATGELAVRFRQPTPVNERLRIEGRVVRARSPIYYVEGRLLREDGAVCATATAKFLKQTRPAFGEGSYDAVYAPGAIRLTDAERL